MFVLALREERHGWQICLKIPAGRSKGAFSRAHPKLVPRRELGLASVYYYCTLYGTLRWNGDEPGQTSEGQTLTETQQLITPRRRRPRRA